MAKDAIVSEELAKKFSTEKDTPYLRWVRSDGCAFACSTTSPTLTWKSR